MKRPTIFQTSAPSKVPYSNSNRLLLPFLIQVFPLLKRSDFGACFMIEIFKFVMLVKLEAYKASVWSRKFSDIEEFRNQHVWSRKFSDIKGFRNQQCQMKETCVCFFLVSCQTT